MPPLLLAAAGAGVAVVLMRPAWLFGAVVGALAGAAFLWIAVSVFWPARADRRCPACGRDALGRADPQTTRGVACRACGHQDPDASGWFLAEDEGRPLEAIVLRQRRSRRGRRART